VTFCAVKTWAVEAPGIVVPQPRWATTKRRGREPGNRIGFDGGKRSGDGENVAASAAMSLRMVAAGSAGVEMRVVGDCGARDFGLVGAGTRATIAASWRSVSRACDDLGGISTGPTKRTAILGFVAAGFI
jgi:hypothetical protein